MALIYITCKDSKEAGKISKHLLNKKLIACANIFPIRSIYKWKNKLVDGNEFVIIAKTADRKFKKAESEIKRIHSYTIPCIIKIRESSNREFDDWVKKETI